jgi:hypothetical protein
MRRVSIRKLMVLIVGAAVGLAALRNANVYWATAITVVLAMVVGASVIGAIALRGKEQCGWIGFAVFSVLYLGLTLGNFLPDRWKDPFRTSALFNYISDVATSHARQTYLGYEPRGQSIPTPRRLPAQKRSAPTR